MKKLRRITEAEVIAEFLKGEFFHKEYDADRQQFADLVHHPDLTNGKENALRRALLFRRRDTMWWELPEDRQWWEVEFEPADVKHVSVFPRAHWRKLARGNFKAQAVAERIRQDMETPQPDEFTRKMAAIRSGMQSESSGGLIVFLGLDEHHPVTLLEGNHRFIASLLAPESNLLTGARQVGVFSPQMEKCCWYKTSFQTLFRCLKNRIQHYWNRDPDVAGLLEQMSSPGTGPGYSESTKPVKPKSI
ncbi:MAG TPA: hypothetical protein VE133_14710 [Candidatus Sulfotelmatobacter sp.]|nr:hypothetical protein [Candidatus Sulfotelmatobacter sp.]